MSGRLAADKTANTEVQTLLKKISADTNMLKKLTKKLGTPVDSMSMREQLDTLRKDCLYNIKQTVELLKTFENKTFKKKFERDLGALQTEFRSANSKASEKERKISVRSSDVAMVEVTLEAGGEDIGSNLEEQRRQQKQLEAAGAVHQATLNTEALLAEENSQDLQQVNHDLHVVKDLFKDVADLVNEQGNDIEKIEVEVDNATDHVEKGNKELDKALYYQAQARRKKCILLIIFVVILALISIPIIISATSSKENPKGQ